VVILVVQQGLGGEGMAAAQKRRAIPASTRMGFFMFLSP